LCRTQKGKLMSFIQAKKLPFEVKEVTLKNQVYYHLVRTSDRTVLTIMSNKKLAECHAEHMNSKIQISRTYGRKKNVF